jgi:hypothetical protein
MEFPAEGAAGHGITKQEAFVPFEIARPARFAVTREIGRSRASEDPGFEQLAGYEG